MSSTSLRRPGVHAVHSVNRFVFSVPDLAQAQRFYTAFGLDVRTQAHRIDLYIHGHSHCWASVHAGAPAKRLEYISFGMDAADADA